MLVERTAALVDHDAVAVRGGGDTLVFYAEHLTRAQRRVLRAHLLAALGDDDEPSVTIAVPSGWAAVEVPSRQRPSAHLTAGTVLFSAAAAAVLAVFVAAVIVLVANEQRGDLTVAQAPDSLPVTTEEAGVPGQDGTTRPTPPAPMIGPGPHGPEQPSEQVATAAGADVPADPSRIAHARRLPADLARPGTTPSVLPDLGAAASEHWRLPEPPAVEPPDLPALPESPDGSVPDAPDLEVEVPAAEEPDPSSGPVEAVDRDGAGDDHDSGGAPDGGSADEEQADGGGAAGRGDAGVDLAD